jgi:hypothetical protein
MPGHKFRRWVYCSHDSETPPVELNDSIGFLCEQMEDVGSGAHHQGYVEFTEAVSLKTCMSLLGFPELKKGSKSPKGIHYRVDPANGSQEQCVAYCTSTWFCRACHFGDHTDSVLTLDWSYTAKLEERSTICQEVEVDHTLCKYVACHKTVHESESMADSEYVAGLGLKGKIGPAYIIGTPMSSIKGGNKVDWSAKRGQNDRQDEEALQLAMDQVPEVGWEVALKELTLSRPVFVAGKWLGITGMLKSLTVSKFKAWPLKAPTSHNTTLWPWQQDLWDQLLIPPKARQLFWVKGLPNSGKSQMFNYLTHNCEHGACDMGKSCSLDNTIFAYKGQGVCMWDLPMCFDYDTFGHALCSTIEKFSDLGQVCTSTKYTGKTVTMNAHVVVFANHDCPEGLSHRDVIHIYCAAPVSLKDYDDTEDPPAKKTKMAL